MASRGREVLDTTEFADCVRKELGETLDTATHDVPNRVLAQVAAYAGLADRALDDVREGLTRAMDDFTDRLFSENDVDPSLWDVLGAQRARAGDDEADVLAAFDALVDESYELVLQCAERVAAPGPVAVAVVRSLWPRTKAVAAELRRHLRAGFRNERMRPLDVRGRSTAVIVDRLLLGEVRHSRAMPAGVHDLGLDPEAALLLVVAVPFPRLAAVELGDGVVRLAEAVDGVAGPVRRQPLHHCIVLAPYRHPLRLEPLAEVARSYRWAVAAVGPVAADDLVATYMRTKQELTLLPACTSVPGVVTADELSHHRLLTSAPIEVQTRFVHEVIGPVLEHRHAAKLLAALHALFETPAGIEAAARRLGLHENTFRNHLRTAEQLTRLSTRIPAQAHRLFTAVRLTRPMFGVTSRGA